MSCMFGDLIYPEFAFSLYALSLLYIYFLVGEGSEAGRLNAASFLKRKESSRLFVACVLELEDFLA